MKQTEAQRAYALKVKEYNRILDESERLFHERIKAPIRAAYGNDDLIEALGREVFGLGY